jgi:hypothetical protein
LSAGLGGDGVLEGRPRRPDLRPLLSELTFLSGSLFSGRLSMLGRCFDTNEGFRDSDSDGRDELGARLDSEWSLCGIASARLGSVSSRMSDKGRVFAQDGALAECPLGSPKVLLTMPLQPTT